MARSHFDAAYFDRYYHRRATRVHGPREIARLARGVTELCAWFAGGEAIASVLDVGAGAGLWRDWFGRHKPGIRYRSVDASAYACRRYGHLRRDIARWRTRERYDLVVCHGVLHYLDDAACEAAIDNLGAMTRGFLYLEAPTADDLVRVVDAEVTDLEVHRRSGRWYRERLGRHYVALGCGLFYARSGRLRFYELERCDGD